MRKALGFICYALMLAADTAAGIFSYRAFVQNISYEYGLLAFVPLFIASYWFSTFFSQLMCLKNGSKLINQKLYTVMNRVSTLINAGLFGFWIYMIITRSLYRNL
ncbi:MAG: hypothetical protein IKO27_05295 [Ruminococcus sp.]|nr:hypothetical protein [Ruminococcus sp.]